MKHGQSLTEQQRQLLARLTSLTASGSLHWENQQGSSHYFADWDGILLILGPDGSSLRNSEQIGYLHITPLFSVKRMEINTENPELRNSLLQLIYAVEAAIESQPETPPFTSEDLLKLLNK